MKIEISKSKAIWPGGDVLSILAFCGIISSIVIDGCHASRCPDSVIVSHSAGIFIARPASAETLFLLEILELNDTHQILQGQVNKATSSVG